MLRSRVISCLSKSGPALIGMGLAQASWSCAAETYDTPGETLDTVPQAEVYGSSQSACDPHTDLTIGIGSPYNAVGYLNGCTAFLIDSQWIATTAHCLADPANGSWMLDGSHNQFSRKFYPNFHPDRALADPYRVPRADVVSWVVGTRTNIDGGHPTEPGGANDWGLARVANWQDVAGLNLTPLPLVTTPSFVNDVVTNPGYPRHWFPLSDMTSDVACGYRAVPYAQAPSGEFYDCQRRWARGIVRHGGVGNSSCRIKGTTDLLTHNCSASGGNSGSPLVNATQTGALGVTAGGGHAFPLPPGQPACTTALTGGTNYTIKAERFINVPRHASNVAVASRWDGAAATGVFASDFHTGRIRYRERVGSSPTFASAFSFWSDIGTVGSYPRAIAACKQTSSNPSPRVFAITGDESYGTTLKSQPAPFISGWSDFTKPSGTTVLSDVDVAAEYSSGRCQVYIIANSDVYTRWMTSETTWSGWARVTTSANYVKITAQMVNNVVFLIMRDTIGRLWWTRYNGAWSAPAQIDFPPGVTSWTDADLGYNSAPSSVLYAYAGGDAVYQRVVYSNGSFGPWFVRWTSLYAKQTADGSAPTLTSITASRWQEAGTVTANLFGTDSYGNVYVLASETDTRWKSFYSQYLPTL